jgi:hypothetical protein
MGLGARNCPLKGFLVKLKGFKLFGNYSFEAFANDFCLVFMLANN